MGLNNTIPSEVSMCDKETGQHEYDDYKCPQCGEELCWACNPTDLRNQGDICMCPVCGKLVFEGEAELSEYPY